MPNMFLLLPIIFPTASSRHHPHYPSAPPGANIGVDHFSDPPHPLKGRAISKDFAGFMDAIARVGSMHLGAKKLRLGTLGTECTRLKIAPRFGKSEVQSSEMFAAAISTWTATEV